MKTPRTQEATFLSDRQSSKRRCLPDIDVPDKTMILVPEFTVEAN